MLFWREKIGAMSGDIAMVELSLLPTCLAAFFAQHHEVLFANCQVFWSVITIHNASGIKQVSITFTLLHTCRAVLGLGDSGCFHVRIETWFLVSTANPRLITGYDGLHKFWVIICKIQRVACPRKFLLFYQQLGNKFRRHSPQAFILS